MSGHNKWSTIKHKKEKTDSKRGKIFTKLIRELTTAARIGGGDENGNPRLRNAIIAARGANMPSDNITRAIKKGTGELEGVSYEEVTYEGYGPDGVAILIDTLTDNKKRTVADVRHRLTKLGGKMAEAGSVSWVFELKGQVQVEGSQELEEKIFEDAIELGAEDIVFTDGIFTITMALDVLDTTKSGLEEKGYPVVEAKVAKVPKTTIKLEGKSAEQMIRMMDFLEDSDDVQNVWANFDIDDSLIEQLGGESE